MDASPRAVLDRLYGPATSLLSWWPSGGPRAGRAAGNGAGPPRVAYYLWHFPVLSQTFVRREVLALRRAGIPLTVLAEAPEDPELLDAAERDLLETTRYLRPVDPALLARYRRRFRREKPALYASVLLYVVSARYGLRKTPRRDRKLFESAVYLAGHLAEIGVDRVHAPWADWSGFTAMLAARLLEVPFSLQVRAHDLHDPAYREPLREMLRGADFVITNTRYNRPFIEAAAPDGVPIHTVYNGIDLARFVPPGERSPGPRIRILCVARLIEQKGLTDLLDACALLRDRGLAFRCDVIGGPEVPLYSSYARELVRRHAALGLEGSVRFRGALPFADVMEAYRSADVFVLPCVLDRNGRRDITPNALIEAMAMKLPVVSTTMTGIGEIVEDGTSGLLVQPGDVPALAAAVERIAADRDFGRRLGDAARRRVEERFDSERNAGARVELFAGPAAHNGGGPWRAS